MFRNILNKILGVYLIALAVVIAIQFAVELTYESAQISSLQVWFVLDWFSLVGFVTCVSMNFLYMRASNDSDSVTWNKLASSIAFYISVGLAMAFLHNFVGTLVGGKDDLLFWKFINVVQVPLFAATGFRLASKQ
ncbi:MAG: hypothetical protein F4X56_01465 [Gammaproteobacteria bacterium]|nr:hypothetical protein [Gammaproteobacteria bacterium]